MQQAHKILEKYWGHRAFRPLQEEIIEAAIGGRDILALLPTGGGKSVCFQLPSLLQEGICIVVSPLVALMEDQVKALNDKGIKALAITGGISFNDLDTLLDNCIYGNYKFLYLSPERLQQDLVQQRIKQMNVNLVAIDEAHCISQWGHDFRPAYTNITVIRELLPKVSFMALTASATKEVVEDIKLQLKLRDPLIFKSSLERNNIALKVLHAEDKIYRLRQLLQNKNDSAIIYVRSRNATMDISRELTHYGYTATAYHGGLSKKDKTLRLSKWLKEDVRIMVATNAFGMGIDKPDVRFVIHLNLPESIESYFQEAGRAGRDGLPSVAAIITNKSDLPILKNQFIKTLPDLDYTILVYKKLCSYFQVAYGEGKDYNVNFNFSAFCNHYQLHSEKAYNTLQLLDRISILKLSQQFKKTSYLQFIISNRHLLHYIDENPRYNAVIKAVLRTYGGIFENKMPVNLNIIASKASYDESQVILAFKQLQKDKIVEFDYQENDATITFLQPREDESSIYPYSKYIKVQAQNKTDKIDSLLSYVANNEICRSKQLLYYFGEKNLKKCGLCSVCDQANRNPGKEILKKIYLEIIKELEGGEKTSREIVATVPYAEEGILKVLQMLLEKNIIKRTASNSYKLNNQ